MNIAAQWCGLVLAIIIALLYIKQRTFTLRTNIAFLFVLLSTIGCISLDILSSLSVWYENAFPEWLDVFIYNSFWASMIIVAFFSANYVCLDVYDVGTARYSIVNKVLVIFTLLGVIAVFASPVSSVVDRELGIAYTKGATVTISYTFFLTIMLYTCCLMLFRRSDMNKRRWKVTMMWMGLWLFSLIVRIWNADMFLIDFCAAVGLVFIYIRMENPDLYKQLTQK